VIESAAEQHGSADAPVVLRSEDVLKGAREVVIQHAGEAYRLRLTSNGKLILTK
jgi:hemin uptake protein HemP